MDAKDKSHVGLSLRAFTQSNEKMESEHQVQIILHHINWHRVRIFYNLKQIGGSACQRDTQDSHATRARTARGMHKAPQRSELPRRKEESNDRRSEALIRHRVDNGRKP